MSIHQSIIANEGELAAVSVAREAGHPERLLSPTDSTPATYELSAAGAHGERLDRFLARSLPQYSRSRLQRWIELGAISWDERVLGRRHRLAGIETLLVEVQPLEAEAAFAPEEVAFNLAHEDDALLVVDKHAGLVVHPGAGNWHGTLLNGLLHRFVSQTALPRAGIVHRLDKDTSGLMVVARTEGSMSHLADQIASRRMGRRYLALVQGNAADRTEVDEPIGRDPAQRIRMAVVRGHGGRAARSVFRKLAEGRLGARAVSLVECRLHTGRTHQIRVHARHLGAPIVGDVLYGGLADSLAPRQALHAWRLELKHPDSGRTQIWTSAWPHDLRALLDSAGIDLNEAMHLADRPFHDAGAL
jgi:23S rRNA pseudouridine1911/1915/1917 synthase